MHVNLPGQQHYRPTSMVSPALQSVLAVGILVLAVWAYQHAPTVRATDQWAYNFLAAVAGLLGLLLIPFAIAAWIRVVRNRAIVPTQSRAHQQKVSGSGWSDSSWD